MYKLGWKRKNHSAESLILMYTVIDTDDLITKSQSCTRKA